MDDTSENTNVAEILFNDLTYPEPAFENESPHDYSHVELLLQLTPHSNKYYVQFQSHSRQFIDLPSSTENQIYRWNGSSIELVQSAVLDHWVSRKVKQSVGGSGRTSMLFSWSSTDASIEARRAKLNKGIRNNSISAPTLSPIEQKRIDVLQKLNMSCTTADSTGKLSRIVESESTRFINARIQLIRTRHSERMNKLISERKRKDHELHLQKMKQIELEQAESERLSIPPESKSSSGGLLGLFGFGGSNSTMATNVNRTASTLRLEELTSTKESTVEENKGFFGMFSPKEKQTKPTTLFERDTTTPGPPAEENFISVNDLEQVLSSQSKNDEIEEEEDDDEEFSEFAVADANAPSQQSTHKFLVISDEIKQSKYSSTSNHDKLLDL